MYALMIDEESGTLWRIPETSICARRPVTTSIPSTTWEGAIDRAKRDAYTFVNAEVIRDLTRGITPSAHFPTHALQAVDHRGAPRVVYTQTMKIMHARQPCAPERFHWPLAFEQQAEVFESASADGAPIVGYGKPVSPRLPSPGQRPSPRTIKGATLVTNFAEITDGERAFFVSVSCAPYLFRDCSSSLEQYWKSTKLHKEHFPSRLALKNRIGRNAELRNLKSVQTLLEKTLDPTIEKRVVENASKGLEILSELQITNSQKRQRVTHRVWPDFFCHLPDDIQCLILKYCVQSAFANPNHRAAYREFGALRTISKTFRAQLDKLGSDLVVGAWDELHAFVTHATPLSPERMLHPASWTYREFGCSATLFLHRMACLKHAYVCTQVEHIWVCRQFFFERMAGSLSTNICIERAKGSAKKTLKLESSARLNKLLRIAQESDL